MDLRSKFRGSLLGTGIGDSLGRAYEGGRTQNPEEIKDTASEIEVFRYTDDTQQMIGLAEALVEKEGFDGEYFGKRLVENFDPARRYGPGSTQVIRSLERREPWDEPAQRLFGGEGSYGNGSSMRVAPVGLFSYDDLKNLRSLARDSSRISHVHRLGMEGAVVQSASVALAIRREPESALDQGEFLGRVRDLIVEREYEEKLASLEALLQSNPDRSEVVRELGNGIEAFNSVPTALYSFLAHPRSFEEAVVYAVSLGGDADTIGAMAGAISGAYHGYDRIPVEWREKLEDGGLIVELADGLFEVKP